MFVFSRRVNDAVLIGDEIAVKVIRILPDAVELRLQETLAGPDTLVTLRLGDVAQVGQSVRVTLRDVLIAIDEDSVDKARLGFEAPSDVPLCRGELMPPGFRRQPGPGRGPDWYKPGPGAEPSPN